MQTNPPGQSPNNPTLSRPESIVELLRLRARENPSAPAILAPHRLPLTYAGLWSLRHYVAQFLAECGLGRDDRIAVVLPDGPELAAAFLTLGSCASFAPLNPAYRAEEYEYFLADLRARALVVLEGEDSPVRAVAAVRNIAVIEMVIDKEQAAGRFALRGGNRKKAVEPFPGALAQAGDVALLLHTSGTTSKPKLVPLTHRNLCCSAGHIADTLQLTRDDRCLCVMPLFHIHGLIGATLSSLTVGASVVAAPGFRTPLFFEWLDEFAPTWYTAVPTMHQAILARAHDNAPILQRRRLRFIRSSSAALPPSVMLEMERVFQAPVIESYGMTEASHQMASNPLPPRWRKPGSVGLAAGPEVGIMDEHGHLLAQGLTGEIVIRGPNVTRGYEHNTLANQSSFTKGWFRTGDQGYLDNDGYLFITGRLKELINRGGEKIAPREIDEVLLSHPAVAQAVVFPIADPRLGEEIGAAVVLRSGMTTTMEALQQFALNKLADFKVPRQIVFLPEIPKGPTGKLQRIGLAAKLGLTGPRAATSPKPHSLAVPRDSREEKLLGLWQETLRTENLSLDASFLDAGGDSILAAHLLGRIREVFGVDLSILAFFQSPTIAGLSERVAQEQAQTAERSWPKQGPKPYVREMPSNAEKLQTAPRSLPLSFAQQRMWLLHQLEPDSPLYNRPAFLRFRGPLNFPALEASLNEVWRRHEVLRCRLEARAGQPCQFLGEFEPLRLPLIDLASPPASDREAELQKLAETESRRPFDLQREPLYRAALVRLHQEDHLLLLTFHHAVFDGWSFTVLMDELTVHYERFMGAPRDPLPELPIQYADYAGWLQIQTTETQARDREYWRRKLAGYRGPLDLPTDHPRPAWRRSAGSCLSRCLSGELADAIRNFSQREQVTLFMTLLAGFSSWLWQVTKQSDLLVGVPVAGRIHPDTERLIGCFINTLALRLDLSANPTVRELLQQARQVSLEAWDHLHLPFEKLVAELQPDRDPSRLPLLTVLFQLRNLPRPSVPWTPLRIEPYPVQTGTAKADLCLEVIDEPDGLRLECEYAVDLFETHTISRWLGDLEALLAAMVARPEARVSDLASNLAAEPQPRLDPTNPQFEWNAAVKVYPRHRCLPALFEAQAELTPEALAVVCEGQLFTYRTLNQRANQVAHFLRGRGVGTETLVGLCAERSFEMLAGILGILKAGGTYVPLDPQSPRERLAFMVEQTRMPVLLAQRPLAPSLPSQDFKLVFLEDALREGDTANPSAGVTPDSAAYVIYTSGSTGQPKGVVVTHYNVVRLFQATQPGFNFRADDTWTMFHSFAFDFSVWEMWGALLHGGRLVLVPHWTSRSPVEFWQLLSREQVTVLNLTPSAFRQLLWAEERAQAYPLTHLRYILFGGEKLDPATYKPWLLRHGDQHPQLYNLYGITETTVHVTCQRIRMNDQGSDRVSLIGRPLPDLQVYVLDQDLRPVPTGVPGEIFVGGAGLARGYLHRPELTRQKFLPDPFSGTPGKRLYRSGDLGRYRATGELEYLGRSDDQVKIRGHRVELGEVETVVQQCPGVREAIASVREDAPGDQRLIVYAVLDPAVAVTAQQVREKAAQQLPGYMAPNAVVVLDQLPRNANGKVDRQRLPPPPRAALITSSDTPIFHPPTEQRLADIWQALLKIEQVGSQDNFFALGGHSLLAMQLVARVFTQMGIDLPVRAVFESPTLAGLAQVIEQLRPSNTEEAPRGKIKRLNREARRHDNRP